MHRESGSIAAQKGGTHPVGLGKCCFFDPLPPHSEMLRVVRTHRPSMVSGAASFLNFRNVLTEALTSKGDAANGEATSTADSFFPGSFPVPRAVQRRYNASFLQARKKHLVLFCAKCLIPFLNFGGP